jgi:hypothetical protein
LRVRTAVFAAVAGLVLTLVGVGPAQAALVYASFVRPAPITAASPSTIVQVDTSAAGQAYEIDWTASLSGGGGTPLTGTQTGTTHADGSLDDFTISGASLPDGQYDLSADVTMSDPATAATDTVLLQPTTITVVRTPPAVTSVKATASTIYPQIAATPYPGTTTVAWTGSGFSDSDIAVVKNSAGQVLQPIGSSGSTSDGTGYYDDWNGTTDGRTKVSPGTYTVVLEDPYGNESPATVTITVSPLHRIHKTYRTTVTAAGSLAGKFVGRCSQLRKPSLRRWHGSLGFYSNTKCGKQTWKASAVSTEQVARVPAAFSYTELDIAAYGGAARSKPKSHGYLRMLGNNDRWTEAAPLKSAIGEHPVWNFDKDNGAEGFVFPDREIAWGFITEAKGRYDVKSFTITLAYDVVG